MIIRDILDELYQFEDSGTTIMNLSAPEKATRYLQLVELEKMIFSDHECEEFLTGANLLIPDAWDLKFRIKGFIRMSRIRSASDYAYQAGEILSLFIGSLNAEESYTVQITREELVVAHVGFFCDEARKSYSKAKIESEFIGSFLSELLYIIKKHEATKLLNGLYADVCNSNSDLQKYWHFT
ncbi:MAG: hypothetical protein IH946_02740 [Bacteroidetes bacterium]|nr:hypothetical protein [Bacteroidota bacterium]